MKKKKRKKKTKKKTHEKKTWLLRKQRKTTKRTHRHNRPTAQQANFFSLSFSSSFLEHHFLTFFVSFVLFCCTCTREKPIISQWRGRFLLRQTSFSLRFLLHCSTPIPPEPPHHNLITSQSTPPNPNLHTPPPPFLFLPRFVELKCSSRKEGQWMHTRFLL